MAESKKSSVLDARTGTVTAPHPIRKTVLKPLPPVYERQILIHEGVKDMKEHLEVTIRKAIHETEKAKALMEVLENKVLFENVCEDFEFKSKIAKVVYALMDSVEEIERNLDAAAEILDENDVL